MILYLTKFITILGYLQPTGHGLDMSAVGNLNLDSLMLGVDTSNGGLCVREGCRG